MASSSNSYLNEYSTPSRYSTPPAHSAVARLRGQRGSFTPPSQGQQQYHTPNSNNGRASSSSSSDPFTTPSSSRNTAPGTPGTTPRTRRAGVRIIKSSKKPWYERLAAVPMDLWDKYELSWSESLNLDSDLIADFGYPAGAATLALHILLKLSLGASDAFTSTHNSSDSRSSRLTSSAEARLEELRRSTRGGMAKLSGSRRSFVYTMANTLCWAFVLLSIGNALWLFTRRRQYRLFIRSDPINSPNAKTVTMDSATQTSSNRDEDEEELRIPIWKRALYSAWHFITGDSSTPSGRKKQIQELSVWTPPPFSLRFFAIYSPPLALFTQFLHRTNLIPFSFAALFLLAQTYYLIRIYTQTLSDRLTISKEVMHEYDSKFVNPRINYSRRDASTMTNEAEMVDPREWRGGYAPAERYSTPGSGRKSIRRVG